MTTRDKNSGGAGGTSPKHAAALSDFIAYWQRMRRGGDVPRRSDIDPRGIEALLTNAFIAERIAPGLARMRIAGSHLTDLMGMEVRGMPLSAFLVPAHRDALSLHLVRLFDEPAMVRLQLLSPGGIGAPELTGEMLILPLRSDLGDISRALGCIVTTGTPGRGPRRFDITQGRITPLEGAAHVPQGAGEAPPARPQAVPGFAEPQAPLERSAAPRKGERPYLRLVKS
ncbi:PAS domain-containing protein [Pelagivirga sediminicola]|uniref:PAS domain-containing protein n=1 Tax=Pelagivirga sediminicola TaxID=2170575 RepID=A0A2T7GAZ8_9RHOB|nr:PAS domain-containing protein [Pelagivirga sediminicola]PVA11597.1 PAS domain-containing protein [Pelagivirga sediminicola]